MKKLLLLAALVGLPSAFAAPLLGASGSFPDTAFCKKQGCSHYYTLQHTDSLKEYVYSMAPIAPDLPSGLTRVYRNNGVVVSASYSIPAQDDPMLDEVIYKHVSGLVELMTGKAPTRDYLSKLNCATTPKLPALTKWQGTGKAYTLGCVTYPLTGAWMYVYNVY